MSFLRGKKSPGVAPDFTGLQLQTSVNTLPIPIVWGQTKLSANVIWYNNFKATAQTTKSSGKGGGGKSTVSGYTYSADLMMALCEGPIVGIGTIWKNQSTFSLASLGLSFLPGTTPQTVWGYLAANDPAQALSYQGTAWVGAGSYQLGASANIGNHNFEVIGVLAGTGINGVDADPALVISDFLTNAQYGVGFSGASINATTLFGASGDASLQTYCRALGLAFSPALINQEQSSSILTRWLQVLNCAAVWSGGQLKFIPYGDSVVAGNGYTFNPILSPIYNLTDLDFVDEKGSSDPVKVSRLDPFSLPTIQRLECFSRPNQYGATPVESRDQAQIELYGPRVGSTIQAHEICDPIVVGATVSQILLQRALYLRAHFTFKLSWEYCLLDPMDIVTISDVNLGLASFPVRLLSIEEDDKGLLTIVAEELTAGVSTAALYPTTAPISTPPNQGAPAAPVNTPVIFEPPPSLTGGIAQLWVGASGGVAGIADPNWGGAFVWASLDNVTYTQIATLTQPARQGLLTAPLALGSGFDTAHALAVNMAMSAGVLNGTTDSGAQSGVTISLVDNELLAYASATLSGANAYNLTRLQRGMYGSGAALHAVGAPFARLDGAIVQYNLPANYVGQTLWLKFQSFNVFGVGVQSLATCATYPYAPTGAGSADPIATQLASGLPVDLGLVSVPASVFDDFSSITAAPTGVLDLGNLTS